MATSQAHSRKMKRSRMRRLTSQEIKLIKDADKSVSTSALAKKLDTSTVTIRRHRNPDRKDAAKTSRPPVAVNGSKKIVQPPQAATTKERLLSIDRDSITVRIPIKLVIESLFGGAGVSAS